MTHTDEAILDTDQALSPPTGDNGASSPAAIRAAEPAAGRTGGQLAAQSEEGSTVGIVLLTAAGERCPRVADDVPMSELVMELARHYELDGDWVLAERDGRVLLGRETLHVAGIRDGDELALIPADAARPTPGARPPSDRADQRARQQHVVGPVSERTAVMLPARPGPGGRVQALWRAVFPVAGDPASSVADGLVDPVGLGRALRPSLVRRVRQAARHSGYEHRLEGVVGAPVLARCAVRGDRGDLRQGPGG